MAGLPVASSAATGVRWVFESFLLIKHNYRYFARRPFSPLWWEAALLIGLLSFLLAIVPQLLR